MGSVKREKLVYQDGNCSHPITREPIVMAPNLLQDGAGSNVLYSMVASIDQWTEQVQAWMVEWYLKRVLQESWTLKLETFTLSAAKNVVHLYLLQ